MRTADIAVQSHGALLRVVWECRRFRPALTVTMLKLRFRFGRLVATLRVTLGISATSSQRYAVLVLPFGILRYIALKSFLLLV
jgi:hypothetical protein